MGWITVGAVLFAVGTAVTGLAARRSRDQSSSTPAGMVVGVGLGLAGWGLVALVLGLVRVA